MFTGLVEEIGTVESVIIGANSAKITIRAKKVLEDIKLGDSISTNGVCLTVTNHTENGFSIDVMPETMRRSNLGTLKNGSRINLERALKLGDRLGGHIVSGHIDGVGTVRGFKKEDNATWIHIGAKQEIIKYIVQKGSVAIDGTSLTVADVDDSSFKVSIIPLTRDETTILEKNIGDQVNLECDMVGKYIEKFVLFKNNQHPKKEIDMTFLVENGFI
ncbi:riboflavin synthase [Brassicibacter mesophilus]|uniref:riboflavin synthase n=1 Tax=Brassicibacter mesophilus TaxID=745119 RepID=UPI003D1EF70B